MHRCIELARLGAGSVAPNPMVGAVLVHNNRIIGEGFHRQYGEAHAEVNCIASVPAALRPLIPASTLYVSLEPCAHTGKTPPCTGLIISNNIRHVVIGTKDPFQQVNGQGIQQLTAAGITVETSILELECGELNKRFFVNQLQRRPFIVLKWAQTADRKIARSDGSRLLISNEYSNRLVHKWRSEEAAILVGSNTALLDDPALTNRYWKGNNPVRLVIDRSLSLPAKLQLFDGSVKTIVFNELKEQPPARHNLVYYPLQKGEPLIPQLMEALYRLQIQSVLVEGGARLLQLFIQANAWDEARVITNTTMKEDEGLPAPELPGAQLLHTAFLQQDAIALYRPTKPD